MSPPAAERVLLTGATGFIGSFVLREVLAAGRPVVALTRPGSDRRRLGDLSTHPGLQWIEADLADSATLARHVEQVAPQSCIHLAWYAEHGKFWTALENLDMLQASLELARLLVRVGCRRLVGAGTCVEYAFEPGRLSEQHSALRPASLYAASKLSLHYLLDQLQRQSSMEVAWLRFFHLYGPGEDPRRLVPYVIRSLLAGHPAEARSGGQVRDFLHVADAASAVWAVAQSGLSQAVNVASGRPMAVADLLTRIGRLMGREDLIRHGSSAPAPGEPRELCADTARLEATGWSPRFDLDAGLEDTIRWWDERRGAKA